MSDEHQHMLDVRQQARQIYSLKQLDTAIDAMAEKIRTDLSGLDPVLITVMNGGVFLAGQLLPRLDFPLEVDYLHATRYRGETSGGTIQWLATPQTPLLDRHVLILDDILDVGSTLLAIIEACQSQSPASVRTAVLVDKIHDRKAAPGLKADYTGVEAEDVYLFGAGMDYKGYWRNAPGLFAVDEA